MVAQDSLGIPGPVEDFGALETSMNAHFSVDLVLLQFQSTTLGHTDDGSFADLYGIMAITANAFGEEFSVGVNKEV